MNASVPPEPLESDNETYTDEQLDWYLPGRKKSPERSPDEPAMISKQSHLKTIIQKLHIGTTLAALFLFFLPWIDIRCSGKSFATQSGIQTIYGGGSLAGEMEAFSEKYQDSEESKDEENMGFSPLVALALLAVVGGVVVSFLALRSGNPKQTNLVGMLCAAALVLISAQMAIGFPVKKGLSESMAESSKNEASGKFKDPLGSGMAEAMMMQIQVRHLPSLYLTLVMLGLPTLMLANGLLDKMKKE